MDRLTDIKVVYEQTIDLIEEKGWFQKRANKLGEVCLVYALSCVTKDQDLFAKSYIKHNQGIDKCLKIVYTSYF